ncbi:hypothetical protein HpMS178_14750 [Helicobacter pylori]
MDEKMKAILGKHYEGHQIVSAQAAFYGLSSALLPESGFYKNKQKFLEIFKVEELLLYKSRFQQLEEFISEELLRNSRAKIMKSNCNKALKVIEKLQNTIATMIDGQINPTIREIKNHQEETHSNLDRSRDEYISNLKGSSQNEIERFKADFREEIHAHIDDDIENNVFKTMFDHELQKGVEKLHENIKKRFEECNKRFCEDIKEAIERFEERIKDSLVMLEHINVDSGFDFNIDSGIDKIGLFASIGGLLLLLAVPVLGEIALAVGIVLGAIGVVKSVWSWFSSDHKKSQQKKEVDKNLDKVCGIIEEKMRNQIEDAKKGICEKVENLKVRLNDSVVCYEHMKEGLIKAGEGLWHLSNNIKTRIAQ